MDLRNFAVKILVMFFIIGLIDIKAQTYSVKGNIFDINTKLALSYANIRVAGTMNGTSSNAVGEFELNLEAGKYQLIASYIGYI